MLDGDEAAGHVALQTSRKRDRVPHPPPHGRRRLAARTLVAQARRSRLPRSTSATSRGPTPPATTPRSPPSRISARCRENWDPRDRAPPPQNLEVWDDEAYERTARALASRGLDPSPSHRRLPPRLVPRQWGPLRPYVLTSERDQEARQRNPALGPDRQEATVTAARRPADNRRVLRQASARRAILRWRQAGASAAVIARGLGTDIRTIHRTLADLRKRAGRKERP